MPNPDEYLYPDADGAECLSSDDSRPHLGTAIGAVSEILAAIVDAHENDIDIMDSLERFREEVCGG